MIKKLSSISPPAIAGVVKAKSANGAIAEIKNCLYDGASMIDLHLHCLECTDEELSRVMTSSSLPVLALNYSKEFAEGMDPDRFEQDRVDTMLRAVRAGAAGIDMQGYTFHRPSCQGFYGEDKYSFTKGNPKEIITDERLISKQRELIEQVHSMGAEVLLSCHPGIFMNCEQVVELAQYYEKRDHDIIKIVTAECDTEEQMIEVMRTMVALKKEIRTPVSYHANGKSGALTRIINPLLGGQIAFCVDRFAEDSTMFQLDLRTARAVVDNIRKLV